MQSYKQTPPKNTIRASTIRLESDTINEIKKKIKVKKEYSGLDSFPPFASHIYKKIFNEEESQLKKVTCTVYPPDYEGSLEYLPVNDSIAVCIIGKEDVLEVSTKYEIIEKIPKTYRGMMEDNIKTVYFREGVSYFMDSFPFSIISNYKQLSKFTDRVTIPAFKGGRERDIKLNKDGSYVLVFSRLCGEITIKKIISMLTGRDDVQIKVSKLLNCKNFDEVLDTLREKIDEIKRTESSRKVRPEDAEMINKAFDDI